MNTFRLALVRAVAALLPETRCFALKRSLYRFAGAGIGENTRVCSSVRIFGNGALEVGRGSWIGPGTMIVTGAHVRIGAGVDIGPRVFIGTGTHERGTGNKAAGPGLHRPVSVGDGCWIGAGAIVLPGVTLAARTTIGAGAVVTRDTGEEGTTLVGNPAREINESREAAAE